MKIEMENNIPLVKDLQPGTIYETVAGKQYMRIAGSDLPPFEEVTILSLSNYRVSKCGSEYRPHKIIRGTVEPAQQSFVLTLSRRELEMLEWDMRNAPVDRSRSAGDGNVWSIMKTLINNALDT